MAPVRWSLDSVAGKLIAMNRARSKIAAHLCWARHPACLFTNAHR
jgi:hypothetical protein